MSEKGATRALAEFAAGLTPASIPAEVQDKLGVLLLDHLRVCSIGERLPWAEWARSYIRQVAATGDARVLFSDDMLNPQHATFMNVAYGSSFDADDTHVGAMLHPGIAVWSAALAVAEHVNASGSKIRAAVTAGYEAMIRIALAMQPSHFKRGYQSTGTCGVFGAGVASASLLFDGPDREQRIAEAIGLAAGYSSGLVQYYHSGASAKRIQAAHAAQSGVAATLLVNAGFSGPMDILEGAGGFYRAFAQEVNLKTVTQGLGREFHIPDVLVKGYAAAARVHSAVEGMFALREEHAFGDEEIEHVYIGIPSIIQGRLTNPHPVDVQAAQMCLPFSVALAACLPLESGRIPMLTVEDYEAHIADPRVSAIEDRMQIEVDAEVEAASGKQSTAAKVVVRLRSGVNLSIFIPAPKGSASRPFTQQESAGRFVQELSKRLPQPVCGDIVSASQHLVELDARWLGRLLSGQQ